MDEEAPHGAEPDPQSDPKPGAEAHAASKGSSQNPYAPPAAAPDPLPEVPLNKPTRASQGQRIAGALMLLNAAFIFAESVLIKEAPNPATQALRPMFGLGPALIDVLIGAVLLSGVRSLATWAILRCSLGLVVGAALAWMNGPFAMVMQIAMSGALLALLIGDAGRARILVASCAFGLYGIVELVGLASIATGKNPLASLAASMRGDIEGPPVSHLRGAKAVAWELDLPGKLWFHLKQSPSRPMGPGVEAWLARPDARAEVLVITEYAPGKMLPIDTYTDLLMDTLKTRLNFTLLGKEPWKAHPEDGTLVRVSMTVEGIQYVYIYGIVTTFERAFQVVACAPKEGFAQVEPELLTIVHSFRLPQGALAGVPEDVEPAPVSVVRGAKLPYSLKAPGSHWHLRKQEHIVKDNAAIDRWIVWPQKNAHVTSIAEEVDAGVVDLDRFVEAVINNMKTGDTTFNVVSQTAYRNDPKRGQVIHAQSKLGGSVIRRTILVWSDGRRGVQLISSYDESDAKHVEPEITRIFDSFELL